MVFCSFYYRPQRSCGQGYVFTRVCDSVHRGGLRAGRAHPDQGEPPRTRENPPPDQGEPPRTRENPPGPGRTPLDQGEPPPDQGKPPRPGPGRPPPGSRLQNTVYERPVRILLECILVYLFIFKCVSP